MKKAFGASCAMGAVCAFVAAALLASCASVSHYDLIDEEIRQSNYQVGLDLIKDAKEEAYQVNDRIVYYLDAGMLAHFAGQYAESSALLSDAEGAIEEAFTKSVTTEVSSYLVNDTTLVYPGEDYEDIYLNAFKSLNYFHAGSADDALVEIRRIDTKLKGLSIKYAAALDSAEASAKTDSYDPASAKVNFSDSALARYLGMVLYRDQGQYDDARIDRDHIAKAFRDQAGLYQFPVPASIAQELETPKGKARLNVISFHGLSPVKEPFVTRIHLDGDSWIKIAVPILVPRPSRVSRAEVVMGDGAVFPLEPLEDMGAVAAETFKRKAALIYLKTVIRSTAKTASSMALDTASNKASGDAALLLSVLSLGTQVFAEASEQADLRISRYFPAVASVGGITLAPGTYSYTVRFYDHSNRLLDEVPFENVEVKSGRTNLSEAICVK
jgi:hypothetical protein